MVTTTVGTRRAAQIPFPVTRFMMSLRLLLGCALLLSSSASFAQQPVTGWQLQDVAKVPDAPATVSTAAFHPHDWYKATVPGTVLTTLVDNHVYPEPLYGENMRRIPESLNTTSYWYRSVFPVPAAFKGRHTWMHFGGINYSAEIWVNGQQAGSMRGAFIRGDFDITPFVHPGRPAVVAVLIHPQPHPGVPHEHTVANGTGTNGGDTAIDGPTFLSTIGWDWLPAVRDRDTGLWLPVTLSSSGPVVVRDPFITSQLSASHDAADLKLSTTLQNVTAAPISGTLIATISGHGPDIVLRRAVNIAANSSSTLSLDSASAPELHLAHPSLWWPNGYGAPNLYKLTLRFEAGRQTSDTLAQTFGIRSVQYEAPGSDVLTLVVNGVKVMVRGGDWGLDEGLKRIPRERLEAQFHLHALAHLNMVRNWVGQSTSPDFYEAADRYGILLWDEFFQPNPSDGPNVADVPTYLANVQDKILRYRNHPSIVVWCARNEGKPPKELDDALASMMAKLDPTRLYQSSSTEGRGVSSHGPYHWRAPHFFYVTEEAFKTETGSVSVPTIESIQGMMPRKDWETINDDWAQHDMSRGAQRGDQYPSVLARRYGPIRNLADFARKAQLANYEAFRAMYEGRNAKMFTETTGILTWMSHPAQPSFVWQLYHYDLEPNASLYAVQKASEPIHIQFNEQERQVEVVNNTPETLHGLKLKQTLYAIDGSIHGQHTATVDSVSASSTRRLYTFLPDPRPIQTYFLKLDLTDATGKLLSTNFYWENVAQDEFRDLASLPTATVQVNASAHTEGANTLYNVSVSNPGRAVALMVHLQLHKQPNGDRVLPVFYSDNYLSLAPGESRSLTIEAATKDLAGGPGALLVDGYNVAVQPQTSPIPVALNENAQPMHWPASNLVPEPSATH